MIDGYSSALAIRDGVKSQRLTAEAVTEHYLAVIEKGNVAVNAFTQVLRERALLQARRVDARISAGEDPGQLCGVPFAVKNLFDIQGLSTLAGSKINQALRPAEKDAVLIKRLESEGAILVGALGMGEFAYDFTGENSHYGNCANPWNTAHMSGGSSSGSGAAVAAGLVPLSLGSDTNGSIRVPASFCGIFGLKPTYGRLPRTNTFPFSDSLDHLGPMARTVGDLALSFNILQGYDGGDHACVDRIPVDCSAEEISKPIDKLRIKRAAGFFDTAEFPPAQRAVDAVCDALNISEETVLTGAAEGRSAAYIITNVEGSRLHFSNLQNRAAEFDPDTRDRFIAGAMLPASWYLRAQQVRHWYKAQVQDIFRETDIIIAPATPCTAPKMGEKTLVIAGEKQLLRPNLGLFTQPISAIGLPSCVVPCFDEASQMPIGVQIIAPPWKEDWCLRVASALEHKGFVSRVPTPMA